MKDIISTVYREAYFIIEHNASVRKCAREFGRCKSTIHYDMQNRLPSIDPILAEKVMEIFKSNYADKHNRGGNVIKQRWEIIHNQKRKGKEVDDGSREHS